MRGFFAIELPESVTSALSTVAAGLREAVPGAASLRWVPEANYHLTLRYLGQVAEPEPILQQVGEEFGSLAPLDLSLGELGTFGDRYPSVLWAGVSGAGLERLAERVEAACRRAGYPPEERPYRAHVTLARVPRGTSGRVLRGLTEAVETLSVPATESFRVGQVVLFESKLGAERSPVYTPVARLELGVRGA